MASAVLAQHAETGRPVEILFTEPETATRWKALVRPGRRCRKGDALVVPGEPGPSLHVTDVEPDGSSSCHGASPLAATAARHLAEPLSVLDRPRERGS